jgi:hypothetical protein
VNIAAAGLVVVAFALLLRLLHVASHLREVDRQSRSLLSALRDVSLDDREKGTQLRRGALRLFALWAVIVATGLGALVLPLGGAWLASRSDVIDFAAVLQILQRVDFLAAAALAGSVIWALMKVSAKR